MLSFADLFKAYCSDVLDINLFAARIISSAERIKAMLESIVNKALKSVDDKPDDDLEDRSSKSSGHDHLTVDSSVEVSAKEYQKDKCTNGMKIHNFTECCR